MATYFSLIHPTKNRGLSYELILLLLILLFTWPFRIFLDHGLLVARVLRQLSNKEVRMSGPPPTSHPGGPVFLSSSSNLPKICVPFVALPAARLPPIHFQFTGAHKLPLMAKYAFNKVRDTTHVKEYNQAQS